MSKKAKSLPKILTIFASNSTAIASDHDSLYDDENNGERGNQNPAEYECLQFKHHSRVHYSSKMSNCTIGQSNDEATEHNVEQQSDQCREHLNYRTESW